ncbi:MAG: RDD family protein [Deltaproteobacteria bacterium]|nr:RDD family protein [Deltaproteobacteria bacterium]
MADDENTDEKQPRQFEETTDMASADEMQEMLDETTPFPRHSTNDSVTNTIERWDDNVSDDEVTPIPQTGLHLASLRDRAASGFVDLLLLGYLYWVALFGYNQLLWHEMLRPFPSGKHAIIFNGLFLLACYLYFFISEGIFFTTLGKFFTRLSVYSTAGEPASLLAVALRNLIRPIDYILLILPTWILMEKLPRRQRLGDFLSRTVVMKQSPSSQVRIPVSGRTSSGTLRILSGIPDFAAALAWMAGIALFIDYQRPIFSFFIILLLPVFYLLWHLVWECLFQTTLGQWIFGLKIAKEEGAPIGFSEALLRALFSLFDTNPLGWVSCFLSAKNQKPSDVIAGTVVVHAKRTWHPIIGVVVSLLLIATVWFAGMVNPRNYLTPFFKMDFLSKIFTIRVGGGTALSATKGLFVKRFSFLLADRKTPRPSAEFKPGETIYFSFDVTGFAVRNNEAWIQEDLTVRYPDNAIGFKQETIVDFHQLLKEPEIPLEIVNTLALPPNAQPGHYTLVLVLHDRFSDKHLTEQRTFLVSP